MRIAIDARPLTGRFTGDRTYWRNLLRVLPALAPDDEFLLYSRVPIPPGELPDAPNMRCRVLDAPNDRFFTLLALPRALHADHADLAHVQYTTSPRFLSPCPFVTTVHDISFKLFPQWFPLRHRLALNLTVPASMRGAARVITDSESSRKDILRAYDLPAEKVVGIPLGLPEGFGAEPNPPENPSPPRPPSPTLRERGESMANSSPLPQRGRGAGGEGHWVGGLGGLGAEPFVLAVGVLQPRKNLKLLAEAFGQAKHAHSLPHRLVLVGKAGWGDGPDALREAAARGGGKAAADALTYTGYVEDADLPRLYRACDVFAYPSLYEGFGLPPLEAMACGAPVLVSDAPAMPEVAGDAALIVPATDVNAWADALSRVLTDAELRRDLSERGPRRAAQFTWQKTAERTLAVYRDAVRK